MNERNDLADYEIQELLKEVDRRKGGYRYQKDGWRVMIAAAGQLPTFGSVPMPQGKAHKLLENMHKAFPHLDLAIVPFDTHPREE